MDDEGWKENNSFDNNMSDYNVKDEQNKKIHSYILTLTRTSNTKQFFKVILFIYLTLCWKYIWLCIVK